MEAELSRIRVTENNEKLFEEYGCDDLYHVTRIFAIVFVIANMT